MFDPMKQILSIYEASRNTYTIAHLDDFEAPQCEHAAHDADPTFHTGAAAYLMATPCGHHEGYLCAPYAIWAQGQRGGRCGDCLEWSEISAYTFIPIGGNS